MAESTSGNCPQMPLENPKVEFATVVLTRQPYSTDLTDSQWEAIVTLFKGMRNRYWPKRELLNTLLHKIDNGCKWRNLPHDFPPWKTIYTFFLRAKKSGLWDDILEFLIEISR